MTSHIMQAAVLPSRDAAFQITDLPRPVPKAGEVLVRVHAAGLNPLDAKIRAGAAPHAQHPLPAILGIDLAGVVEAVGPGVVPFHPGDAVYGMTGGVGGLQGSLAQYAAVDGDLLALKPASLSMVEAAALPLVAITAWEGLVDRADVRAGQTVLVLGGAGGVGHVAVQIARARGARVFAVDRAHKAGLLRELGAVPIDSEKPPADYVAEHTGGLGFDVVYDTLGGEGLDNAFLAVGRFGHVVSCLGWGTHRLAPLSFKAATYSGVFTLSPLLTGEGRAHHGEILAAVAALLDAGQVAPRLDPRSFALSNVEEAYAALGDRSASGKLVVGLV